MVLTPLIARQGIREGIELCLQSVIPSLFPFIFLTSMISGRSDLLSVPPLRTLGKWTGIPSGGETILLLGWFGGYPIGAKCIYENYKAGQLSLTAARRLLGFCNNAGPSFIFGVLFCVFPRPILLFILWFIQIFSSLLTGILLPKEKEIVNINIRLQPTSPSQALQTATQAMVTICGWILIFRLPFVYLKQFLFPDLSPFLSALVTGILELTNGCILLNQIGSEPLRFVCCSVLLTFGGLCVSLQTMSLVKELGIRSYFRGKAIQCCISLALSLLAIWIFF